MCSFANLSANKNEENLNFRFHSSASTAYAISLKRALKITSSVHPCLFRQLHVIIIIYVYVHHSCPKYTPIWLIDDNDQQSITTTGAYDNNQLLSINWYQFLVFFFSLPLNIYYQKKFLHSKSKEKKSCTVGQGKKNRASLSSRRILWKTSLLFKLKSVTFLLRIKENTS